MSTTMANEQSAIKQPPVRVWWSNAILFVAIHIAACVGVYHYPYYATCKETLVLAFVCWQVACFGCVSKRLKVVDVLILRQDNHRIP